MGDNNQTTLPGNDPASHAPDAAAYDKGKGKGKAVEEDRMEMSNDEEESDESEVEETMLEDDDDENDNLEPVSTSNIISGGRRTRGKNIDFQEAAEKIKGDEMDEDEDDEDFEPTDDKDKMH
ncbi:histone chaperone domain CHZ-domain-containing protein [Aspergillus egyptiacus]|nr:histone chaperone domain CHZ-domain-containing protein [Aspergillus egyptiacus]